MTTQQYRQPGVLARDVAAVPIDDLFYDWYKGALDLDPVHWVRFDPKYTRFVGILFMVSQVSTWG